MSAILDHHDLLIIALHMWQGPGRGFRRGYGRWDSLRSWSSLGSYGYACGVALLCRALLEQSLRRAKDPAYSRAPFAAGRFQGRRKAAIAISAHPAIRVMPPARGDETVGKADPIECTQGGDRHKTATVPMTRTITGNPRLSSHESPRHGQSGRQGPIRTRA